MASENVQVNIEESEHLSTPEQNLVSSEFLETFYNNGGYQHQNYLSNCTPHYPENRRFATATTLDYNRNVNNNQITTNATRQPTYQFLLNFFWKILNMFRIVKHTNSKRLARKSKFQQIRVDIEDKDFLTAYTGGHSLFLVSFFPFEL